MSVNKLLEELAKASKGSDMEETTEHVIALVRERKNIVDKAPESYKINASVIRSNIEETLVHLCGMFLGASRPTNEEIRELIK